MVSIGRFCRNDGSRTRTFGMLLPFAVEAKTVNAVAVKFHMSHFEIGCYDTATRLSILSSGHTARCDHRLNSRSLLSGLRRCLREILLLCSRRMLLQSVIQG